MPVYLLLQNVYGAVGYLKITRCCRNM